VLWSNFVLGFTGKAGQVPIMSSCAHHKNTYLVLI